MASRKEVICLHCQHSACRYCCTRYILGSSKPASCMQCMKIWGVSFLFANFTKVWISGKEYRTHKERILLEQQRLLLPTSMAAARRAKRIADNRNHYSRYLITLRRLQLKLQELALEKQLQYTKDNKAESIRILREQKAAEAEIKRTRGLMNNIDRQEASGWPDDETGANEEEGDEAEETKTGGKITGRCAKPDCKGYVARSVCQLCETKACKNCGACLENDVSKSNPHECKEGDIATHQLLLEDTKYCPKCFVGIYKIDGCDQMYCTACNTFFSWRTGLVLKGEYHNPHFYELRQQQRARRQAGGDLGDDDDMRGCLGGASFRRLFGRDVLGSKEYHADIAIASAELDSDHAADAQRGRDISERLDTELGNLRVSWLVGDIETEKRWREKIHAVQHKYAVKKEASDVQEAWGMTVRSVLAAFYNYQAEHPEMEKDKGKDGWYARALETLLEIKELTLAAERNMKMSLQILGSVAVHFPTARKENDDPDCYSVRERNTCIQQGGEERVTPPHTSTNAVFRWYSTDLDAAEKAWRTGDMRNIARADSRRLRATTIPAASVVFAAFSRT